MVGNGSGYTCDMPRTYFEVVSDPDRFQYFLLDDPSAVDRYTFDGRPLAKRWRPPSVYSYEPRLPEGDFWDFGLGGFGTTFAVRPEAHSRSGLRQYLSSVGELLPLPYGGRDFAVWNLTHCIDALDRDASSWLHYDNGERFRVKVPRFREDRLGWNVFKVPEIPESIYAWVDDKTEPLQLFVRLVEHEGLTGLTFRELYTT
jgi:hypothetical protein